MVWVDEREVKMEVRSARGVGSEAGSVILIGGGRSFCRKKRACLRSGGIGRWLNEVLKF